jgi:hypothetical protein
VSGLFARLAARALGGASPVRPLAGTPYASPPALLEEDSGSVAPAQNRLEPAPVVLAAQTREAAHSEPPRDAEPAPFAARARAPEATETSRVAALAGFSVEARPVEAGVRARPASIPAGRARDVTLGPGEFEPSDPRPRPEAPPMAPPVVPRSSLPAPAAPFLPVVPPSEGARARGEGAAITAPRSLLPAQPVLQPRSGAVPPSQRSAPSIALDRATAETTTEVHVSIGRIEVTAMGAPPPARRRASPVQTPLSLADYLNARQTRRR